MEIGAKKDTGNTLFLTILVSMLSNTFSTIVSNATAEIQYRHAVQTLEGVKSDAIFAYQPPFNILAMFVLVPLRWVVSPRWFHKIHVFFVRLLNLPLLLIIAATERRLLLWPGSDAAVATAGREWDWFWDKWRITVHGDIHAVFDLPPPGEMEEAISVDDELTHNMIRRHFQRNSTADSTNLESIIRRQKQKHQEQQSQQQSQQPSPQQSQSQSQNQSEWAQGDAKGDATPLQRPKSPGRTLSRRDSMAPFPGLRQELQGILTDSEEMSTMTARLDAMEESNARIEAMLARLVDDIDGSGSAEEEEAAGKTGTLRDLDHTAGEQ